MVQAEQDGPWNALPPTRFPGVRTIIMVTVAMFVLQELSGFRTNNALADLLALSREGVMARGRIWQLVTYQFVHGGFLHILFNMLMLFSLGREVENMLGTRRFVWLYLASGAVGGLGWLVLNGADAPGCIGASGAVLGVAAAFAAIEPKRRLSFIIFPVPWPITMTAFAWLMAFGAGTLALLWLQAPSLGLLPAGNVAHSAHLLGGVAGYVYGRSVRTRVRLGLDLSAPKPPPTPSPWEARAEVDRILEKIKAQGIESLSRRERDLLDRASKDG